MSPIDQKRIARNTMLLYLRMGCLMLVSLYTSRVILDALGETDFGIYNTVAGIVLMFSFLSNTMSTACQRFFAVELGRNDLDALKKVFSLCVEVFAVILFLVFILCETAGIWLLYRKIQVDGRMGAAMWIFQCAVVSFAFTILRTPYQGMIIIREKMKVFTYISVFEALGNLAIAILIAHSGSDRLVLYGTLMMAVNVAVSLYYIVYCNACYRECRFRRYWHKDTFLEIFSFAGWNMIGSLATVGKSQGVTVLINMFFGNAMVSARAMAYKVYATIQQFVDNFFLAVKPQIMKSYSEGDIAGMSKLVCQSSRFSYFLMFAIALPLMLETDSILNVWLKDVPEYTVLFTRLVIVNALIDTMAGPLATAMQAYGRIRNYQIVTGGVLLLVLPVSWLLFRLDYPVQTVFWVSIAVCAVCILVRLAFVHNAVGLGYGRYFREVLLPAAAVTVVSVPVPLVVLGAMQPGLIRFLVTCVLCVVMTAASVMTMGVNATERKHIISGLSGYLSAHFDRKS